MPACFVFEGHYCSLALQLSLPFKFVFSRIRRPLWLSRLFFSVHIFQPLTEVICVCKHVFEGSLLLFGTAVTSAVPPPPIVSSRQQQQFHD